MIRVDRELLRVKLLTVFGAQGDARLVDILLRRILDKETLRSIGSDLGVTTERVRQIEARAKRLIRHPFYLRQIIHDPEVPESIFEACFERDRADVFSRNETSMTMVERHLAQEALYGPDREAMQRLSVRAYNCLKRHGYDRLSVVARLSDAELRAIPNLGKGTVREIRSVVAQWQEESR